MNVYKYDTGAKSCIYPFYLSSYSFEKCVNLLLLEDGVTWHYVLIKSLNTILKGKTKRHNIFVCSNCYKKTVSENVFKKHMMICNTSTKQIEEMPKDTILKFRNFKYRQRNAITVYAGIHLFVILLTYTIILNHGFGLTFIHNL